jgi:hypothetical protein
MKFVVLVVSYWYENVTQRERIDLYFIGIRGLACSAEYYGILRDTTEYGVQNLKSINEIQCQ